MAAKEPTREEILHSYFYLLGKVLETIDLLADCPDLPPEERERSRLAIIAAAERRL